jgi:ketosteroid isomerase-like protein
VNDEVLAAFDGLFEALLERSDAEEAMGLFTDGDVVFWGSGKAEQALDRRELAELFGQIAEIGDALTFQWDRRQANVRGDAAWVSAIGNYTYAPPGESPSGGPYRVTAVFVRRDRRWLWHTYSGSEPVD